MVLTYPCMQAVMKHLPFEKRKSLVKTSPKKGSLRKLDELLPYSLPDFLCAITRFELYIIIGQFAIKFTSFENSRTMVTYGRITDSPVNMKNPWMGFFRVLSNGIRRVENIGKEQAAKQWIEYHLNRKGTTRIEKLSIEGTCHLFQNCKDLEVTFLQNQDCKNWYQEDGTPLFRPSNFPKHISTDSTIKLSDPLMINAETITFSQKTELSLDELFALNCRRFDLCPTPPRPFIIDFIRRLVKSDRPVGYVFSMPILGNMEMATLNWIGEQVGARKTKLYGRKSITLDMEFNSNAQVCLNVDRLETRCSLCISVISKRDIKKQSTKKL